MELFPLKLVLSTPGELERAASATSELRGGTLLKLLLRWLDPDAVLETWGDMCAVAAAARAFNAALFSSRSAFFDDI